MFHCAFLFVYFSIYTPTIKFLTNSTMWSKMSLLLWKIRLLSFKVVYEFFKVVYSNNFLNVLLYIKRIPLKTHFTQNIPKELGY